MPPAHLVRPPAPKHHRPASIALGGPDRCAFLITDLVSGDIRVAGMTMTGKTLFAHRQERNGI